MLGPGDTGEEVDMTRLMLPCGLGDVQSGSQVKSGDQG